MIRLPFFRFSIAILMLGSVALGLSCNGGTGPGGGFQSAEGTGFVFIGDDPPVGTSILKFEITLSNATLCPTVGAAGECNGNPQVELITAPVTIELTQLQLQSAFIRSRQVSAGSFAGVRLTFSNPELKLLLPDGTIQELEGVSLPLSPTAVTPTFPSPLTVADSTNFGFLIDFNVPESIQSLGGAVTGIAPVVSLVPQTFSTQQPAAEIEDAIGTVSNLTKNCTTVAGSFNFMDSLTGLPINSVQFDSTTEFVSGVGGVTCETLANNQFIEADIELRSQNASTAAFFATKIELVSEPNEDGLEGTILRVNTASQFVLVVEMSRGIAGISRGALVTVGFDPLDVEFRIESNDFTSLPPFAAGADLLAGQKVELVVVSSIVGTNSCAEVDDDCAATVDRVKLKKSTFTATVGQTIVNPDFALVALPSIFGTSFPLVRRPLSADCQSCITETLTVRTSTGTEFEDLPGDFTGLLTGSTVTVRGMLFKDGFQGPGPTSAGFPLLTAEKVRLVTAAP